MKKLIVSLAMLLCVAGCSLDLMTQDNPLGFTDPNQGAAIFNAGSQVAGTAQAVGVATGNPALIGVGALAGGVVTVLGSSYLKGKKK